MNNGWYIMLCILASCSIYSFSLWLTDNAATIRRWHVALLVLIFTLGGLVFTHHWLTKAVVIILIIDDIRIIRAALSGPETPRGIIDQKPIW